MPRNPIVYVLDDDGAVLAAVASLLSTSLHATECYSSPVNFLARCDLRRPGCLVVDPLIPGIDGGKFLDRVRALHSRLSVLVATHEARDGDIAQWISRGATAVVRKPFDAAEFLAAVDRAIALSQSKYDA